ncbi:MAG: hypothetical protein AVDCRST_MAG49-4752 [uncultured Thermomicrobiales bacterium]|uniref:Uncharacterized protein n=1 Tax=uncultured Thermomicrobiales bacterium TaxID=1645740 RepID=A0A6J4VJ48_9BACT|nr:MAG: hypothetical protein AVDCRST_MAG49-4752 [uncultured Thermomicrobiales bacterium]
MLAFGSRSLPEHEPDRLRRETTCAQPGPFRTTVGPPRGRPLVPTGS